MLQSLLIMYKYVKRSCVTMAVENLHNDREKQKFQKPRNHKYSWYHFVIRKKKLCFVMFSVMCGIWTPGSCERSRAGTFVVMSLDSRFVV